MTLEKQSCENCSEHARELRAIKDKVNDLHASMVYVTKLLESMVNNLSLANKHKNDATEVVKLNSQLMGSLFKGKNFEGKEMFMELINKIQAMGSE